MWKDPIVEEVRAIRDAQGKRFNHNLDAIVADLQHRRKELEKQGWKFVTPKRRSVSRKAA